MTTTDYPKGFTGGLTVRGMPILNAYAKNVLWVDANAPRTSDGTFNRPFATLAAAVAKAKSYDVVMVKPGHTETISSATALALSVAGLQIIGMGVGTGRPTFTLDTAATSTVAVSAANVVVKNIVFVANFADITACFTTSAKGFVVDMCEFRDTSSILNFLSAVATSTTNNASDALIINACDYYGLSATAATCLLTVNADTARAKIDRNHVAHAAVTGGGLITMAGTKKMTQTQIRGNECNLVGATTLTTGTLIITGSSANSGLVIYNKVFSLDATTEIICTAASGFHFFENLSSAVADASGYLLPAADA
jgi:hypothetical protein